MPDDPNTTQDYTRFFVRLPDDTTAATILEAVKLAGLKTPSNLTISAIKVLIDLINRSEQGYEIFLVKDNEGRPYDYPPFKAAYEHGQTERAKATPIPPKRAQLNIVADNTR